MMMYARLVSIITRPVVLTDECTFTPVVNSLHVDDGCEINDNDTTIGNS